MKFEDENFEEEFINWLNNKSEENLVKDLKKYSERKVENGN